MLGIMMLGFSACQDGDWEAPDFSKGAPYGNNQLTEDNIITIAELKQRYPKYAENYTTSEITEDCKLRVRVTGNDIQGNLYNAIAVQEDESGDALIIAITGSDLFAYMAVGQELLVDLKGLYIGAYGKQPQIGTPYAKDENSDAYVSRMPNTLWQQHVKLIGVADPTKVVAQEFTSNANIDKDCGKLMTIKNVSIKEADGKWRVPNANDEKDLEILRNKALLKEFNLCVEQASKPKSNLTGIWKRYNGKWELIIRDIHDIESATETN